ncbi:MAG: universal stress protein [Neptuniibacter sp.]
MNNKYKKIVVPVDLEHESSWKSSLPIAIDFARQSGATLYVVTVVPNSDIPAIAAHLPADADKHIREGGVSILQALVTEQVPQDVTAEAVVSQGTVHREILHIADDLDADLIVMASHRPELYDYFIGANAAHVTRHAKCSVMVVREK